MSFPHLDALIPHRPPMRLIAEIVGEKDGVFVCRGVVPPELAVDGVASPILGIEMGAQAAALMAALAASDGDPGSDAPPIGYLVSIRDARFATPELPAARALTVTARALGGMGALSNYEITVAEPGAAEPLVEATIGTWVDR